VPQVLLSENRSRPKVAEIGGRSARTSRRELTPRQRAEGSLPFMADLMGRITAAVAIDLMEVSSYGGTATESSGPVRS